MHVEKVSTHPQINKENDEDKIKKAFFLQFQDYKQTTPNHFETANGNVLT